MEYAVIDNISIVNLEAAAVVLASNVMPNP
jgi:hypothetical protein